MDNQKTSVTVSHQKFHTRATKIILFIATYLLTSLLVMLPVVNYDLAVWRGIHFKDQEEININNIRTILKEDSFADTFNEYYYNDLRSWGISRGFSTDLRPLVPTNQLKSQLTAIEANFGLGNQILQKQSVPGDGHCGFHSFFVLIFPDLQDRNSEMHRRFFDTTNIQDMVSTKLINFWKEKGMAAVCSGKSYDKLEGSQRSELIMYARILASLNSLKYHDNSVNEALNSRQREEICLIFMFHPEEWIDYRPLSALTRILPLAICYLKLENGVLYTYVLRDEEAPEEDIAGNKTIYMMLTGNHWEPVVAVDSENGSA